eukprot:TRINITY_DN2089_c0_g1_i1.p2 TRINITY_DN2089_c0_g1~~TRINITY_DN2089_c0_g1_i1.p2  ORF type:complete len:192 (-),score=61.09 TRINITY_DN2089_c0_g1_i1:55-630(-)
MGVRVSKHQMQEYREVCKMRFDDEQILYMYKMFHKANPSGEMTREGFKVYIDKLRVFPKVEQSELYDQLFRGYDRNGDGKISFKEYLQYHAAVMHAHENPEKCFDIVFFMYNKKRDGFITHENIVEVITNSTRWVGKCDVETEKVQSLIESEARKIMEQCDHNHDGFIDRDELQKATEEDPQLLGKLMKYA